MRPKKRGKQIQAYTEYNLLAFTNRSVILGDSSTRWISAMQFEVVE